MQPQQQQQQPQQRRFGMAQMPKFPNFQLQQLQPHFNISKFQRNPRPKMNLDVSRAFGSTLNELSNVGVGIATKYPTGYGLKAFQRTAKQIGSQPFNLSGKRAGKPLKPGEKFMLKAQQISNQPFAISGGGGQGTAKYKGGPGRRRDDESLFVSKAQQIANQPFKLIVRPPSAERSPAERFIKRAKQVSNQPFAMSGSKTKITDKEQLNLFKKKAKSIGFLATTTLFHKVIEEEIEKYGRFKSTARAVMKTQRMFRGLREYDPTRGSNEVEIKKGIYPMLRRDVLEVLFQYMPVSELKTARLVCDFWKRFATVCIQQKSVVRLSGICPICKSEYMSNDPDIPEHEHSETISFYRFVLFIQEYPQEKHYGLPFRTFKISKLNLYFIPGLNTIPTRVFLMFLKLWADKIHELRLKAVQLSPPDALYRILDTCSRMRSITFDDVRVWQDPLTNNENAATLKMKLNHYLQSITFCTNWIGEELLHWQMILEAYPCLEEINMIDVSKPDINHFLTALLNLPEEEEIDEVRTTGGFKKMSRKLMFLKVGGPNAPTQAERDRAPSPRLILNMPFSVYRVSRVLQLEETEEQSGFKKMAKSVSIRGVSVVENVVPATVGSKSFKSKARSFMLLGPLGRDSTAALPDTPEPPEEQLITGGIRFKKFAKKMGGMPFKLSSLTPEAEEIIKGEGAVAFKKLASKVSHQPFKLLGRSLTGETTPAEGATEGTEAKATEPPEGTAEGSPKPAAGPPSTSRFRKKAKSYLNQPFKMVPAEKQEPKPEEKKKDKKFRSRARGIINQPFTIVKPEAEQEPEQFVPKTFKSQIKKILHQPFKAKKPSLLLKFKSAAKTLGNQPFALGAPKKQEKVLAGSRLRRINIATRRNFEDQLKIDLANDSDTGDDLSADENGYHSAGSDSDESSTDSIQERDLTLFDTYELLAEAVVRFDITHLTLRVHYTTEDASTFHIVLEACREKVHHLTLTRPPKVYFSELDLKFRSSPFETPEETIIEFPSVRSLSIVHNFVDSIDEISASFPALRKLTVNIIPTEFLVPKKKPYKSYVKTNLMITMRNGRPMPNVKILEWNITEARHPYTLKRTIVYKSNALRYMPRIFPNLSKLVVSITTAHELHVIFRSCTQLHDLVVLKNSFYRTKDSDIIGEPERPEDEEEMYDIEEDEAAMEANLAREVHPTRLRNGGIKQLVFLRRLALQNNNCCLTNRSIEEGFIHLRRLRSLHISLAKRISVRAIRLLKKCRFLVNVRITKDKLKTSGPPPSEDQPPDDDQQPGNGQLQLPQLPPGYPPFCVPVNNVPTNPKLGFESGGKFDKIGGKRYAIVKTTYEVNGRTYELVRKQYECRDDRDSQIWEKRFRIAEKRRLMEEEKKKADERLRQAEINGPEIVRKAEKKLWREQIDQESDYERFMVDYDDDDDDDEEGYCDEDDDHLFKELMVPDEEETSSEDGICLEADTMYEGDKEHYLDTEPKSSTGDESYCDSPSDPEYQADKDTGDETERKQNKQTENKDDQPAEEKIDKPTEQKDGTMTEDKYGKTIVEKGPRQTSQEDAKHSEKKEITAENAAEEMQKQVQPEDSKQSMEAREETETAQAPETLAPGPDTAKTPDATPQASPQPEDKPESGPSTRDAILELLKLKTPKSKGKRKQKEKRKKSSKVHPVAPEQKRTDAKPGSASSTTCTSGPFRHIYSVDSYQTSTSDASVSIRSSRRPSSTSSASPFIPSASTRSASSAASTDRRGHRHSITGDTYEQTSSEVYVHRRASFSASATSRSTPPAPSTSSTTEQLTNEQVGIEYNEQRRRMSLASSLSSHGPSHSSSGHGRHGLHHFDAHQDSNNSTDGENQRALKDKGKKKDKKDKSKRSESKTHKKSKKEKKKRSKSVDGKQRKGKSPMPDDDDLKRAGSVSPSQMQLLGDLRQQLIQKMVNDVRKELKKH